MKILQKLFSTEMQQTVNYNEMALSFNVFLTQTDNIYAQL